MDAQRPSEPRLVLVRPRTGAPPPPARSRSHRSGRQRRPASPEWLPPCSDRAVSSKDVAHALWRATATLVSLRAKPSLRGQASPRVGTRHARERAPQASRLALRRRIAAYKREFDARPRGEVEGPEDRVHAVMSNRNADRGGRAGRIQYPPHIDLFRRKIGNHGRGPCARLCVAIHHQVADRRLPPRDVLRRGGTIGAHGGVAPAVADGCYKLIVDVEGVAELKCPRQACDHYTRRNSQLQHCVTALAASLRSVSLTGCDAATARAGTVKESGPPTARRKVISTVLAGAVTRA